MKSIQTTRLFKPKSLKLLRKFQTGASEKTAEAAAIFQNAEVQSEWDAAKPFHAIPGPKPLPIPYIGNMWRLLPMGTYGKLDFAELHEKLYEDYGPIVRLSGLGKLNQLVIFKPELAEKMFRNESIWPIRSGLASLKYFRTVTRKDFYENREGLVTSQGKEWHEFRSATNQTMMQPKRVKLYLNSMAAVLDDFIERIRYIRLPNEEMPDDFLGELNKLGLESFGMIALDVRMGCLAKALKPDSEAVRMIENVKNAMGYMQELDFNPSPWMYISTPTWRKFVKAMNEILEFANRHTMAKWDAINKQNGNTDESNQSVLEILLKTTKDPKIPIVMATDIFFAGIDTTSNTLGNVLYFLAINPEKQEKLYQELKRLMPRKDSPMTSDIFNELTYTRAVIKETMRVQPTAIANQRTSVKDMVFGGYQVPKGTMVISSNAVMCKLEENFKKPKEFIPERWLKTEADSETSSKNVHPFVFLPFGFGQRSCIGRRFAELEMNVALSKIIRNFKVSYNYGPMTWKTRLVTSPSKPLKFKMAEREQ